MAHEYIKAENRELLAQRLDRIEGQVRGIKRMVDREESFINILAQITSVIAATEKVASILMQDHLDHCVREVMRHGEQADEKIAEFRAALERFLRV